MNDWLLGLWLILLTHLCGRNSLVISMMENGFLRFVYFGQAATFVTLRLLVTPDAGFPGMLVSSIISTCAFTLGYGTWRFAASAGRSLREVLGN
jgi:hypothetical protein